MTASRKTLSGVAFADVEEYGWNRLVRGRHGAFLANPRDIYIGRAMAAYGEYSEAEAAFLAKILRRGDVVVEAGANVGYLTVPIAKAVGGGGAVHAFEPQRYAFQALCANLALNGIGNVSTWWMALGGGVRLDYIALANPLAEGNHGGVELGESFASAFKASDPISVVTLDGFGLPRLSLLKADVEGMEAEVLRGAEATIRRCRPLLYLEADREDRTEELLTFVEALDYKAFWHLPPLFSPTNFLGNGTNLYPGIVSMNVFAAPSERADLGKLLPVGSAVERTTETWRSAHHRLTGVA